MAVHGEAAALRHEEYRMPVMLEQMARPSEVVITDEIRTAWYAATALYRHVDDREDADTRQALPDERMLRTSEVPISFWKPFTTYLARSFRSTDQERKDVGALAEDRVSPETVPFEMPGQAGDCLLEIAGMPDDAPLPTRTLTDRQLQAFTDMSDALHTLSDAEVPLAFAGHFTEWIRAARKAKNARHLRGRNGYMAARRSEAGELAALFTSVIPVLDQGTHFGRFERRVRSMATAAKFLDSAVDLGYDVATENTRLAEEGLLAKRRVGLARTAAVGIALRETAALGVTRPLKTARLVGTAALAARSCRKAGDYKRTHR